MNGVQGVEGSNPFIPTRKQKPQGIYGNVGPFSVFGDLPFSPLLLTFLVAFLQAPREPCGKDLAPTTSRHGRWATASSPAARLYHRQKKPRSISPWLFRILWDRRGQAAGRLPGDPFLRKSSPKGDPRVPFPQPSGKGVSWSNDLQPHPAF